MAIYKNPEWRYPTNTIPSKESRDLIVALENVILNSKKETRNTEFRKSFNKLMPVSATFPLDKKNLSDFLNRLYDKVPEKFHEYIYVLTLIGGVAATVKGLTVNETTLMPPKWVLEERDNILKKYHEKKIDVLEFENQLTKLGDKYIDYLKKQDDGTADIILSGTKGSAKDIRKMILGVGLSIDYKNEVNDVIDKAGVEGLEQTQFFNYSSPALLTQYNKSIGTADPGYLIKLLILSAGNIKLSKVEDCGTKKYMSLTITSDKMIDGLQGKEIISGQLKKGSTVKFRSAFYCNAPDGICLLYTSPSPRD